MANNVVEEGKLLHLFDRIWAMYEELENSAELSSSDASQVILTAYHTDMLLSKPSKGMTNYPI